MLKPYISQEEDFLSFVTMMRAVYDPWLTKAGETKHLHVSVQGTLTGTLQEVCGHSIFIFGNAAWNYISFNSFPQGLAFVNTLHNFWTELKFNPQAFDTECKMWVFLLLRLVDVTGDNPQVHFQLFLGKSLPTSPLKKYRVDIIKHVSWEEML